MSGGLREREALQTTHSSGPTEVGLYAPRRSRFLRPSTTVGRLGPIGVVAALCGFLLYRLAPDVSQKRYFEDEAVAGLISMRPLDEVLDTVLIDRGGAPLHFVLAHAVFWIDASAGALRWLSVIAALAAVPLCFDLARRLGGTGAGVVAAAVAASSTALAIYGSFGRMYGLFVLVSALFADLFVRALRLRTTRSVAAAAAAGWLLPAVHPYGAIPAFVALLVAAVIWRGRPLRAAWPVAIAVAAAIPFLVADLRLAERTTVGSGSDSLASPGEAWVELVGALSSFAGGDGLPFVFFTVLALVGLVLIARRQWAVAVLAASILVPPVLFVVIPTESQPDLSPRHLFYGLPLWAAAIGVAAARLPVPALAVGLVALIAVVSPASALREPRNIEFGTARADSPRAIRTDRNDLLIPYSPLFLASLPNVRQSLVLPHAPAEEILAALEHADEPIGSVHLAVPDQRGWVVLDAHGPFTKAEALGAAAARLRTYLDREGPDRRKELEGWLSWIEPALCNSLRELGRSCP
jgi:hypothetical protein